MQAKRRKEVKEKPMKIFLDGRLYDLEEITQEEINKVRARQRFSETTRIREIEK